MDLLKFLQLFFCCFFPKMGKRNKVPKSFPNFERPPRNFRNRSSQLRQGKDHHQWILFVHSRANYHDLRHKILGDIRFDTRSTLYVMCPENQVPNDYVSTLLNQYGDIVHHLDKWITKDGIAAWAGSVVMYQSVNDAKFAARDIPMRCRYIKIMPLSDILPILVDFELLYTWSNQYYCTALISARRSLDNSDATTLIYDLSNYGKIEKLFFDNRVFSMGIICEVSYPFLTQAYLAMMMTDGRFFGRIKLSTRLADDPRNNGILNNAKECILSRMNSDFP